jgi:hypothetical protein
MSTIYVSSIPHYEGRFGVAYRIEIDLTLPVMRRPKSWAAHTLASRSLPTFLKEIALLRAW